MPNSTPPASFTSRQESLHAPHLIDIEAAQVLRRPARAGTISSNRAAQAVRDLMDLRLTRYPHFVLLSRICQLRNNLSAYDAVYVALAEQLAAPLLSRDAGLSAALGHKASIELF
jgi:predicted nucleic acid-binding protein